MDATSTSRHSSCVIFKSKLHAVCFCCVFSQLARTRFTRVLPQIRRHLKNILKSRLYFHDWMINHIRFRECDAAIMQGTLKYCICMDILLVYTHLDPFQLVLLLRNHGRFWFHCEPIERQGSPGWKWMVDNLCFQCGDQQLDHLTKTQAFSIWEIEHIRYLETTCGDFFVNEHIWYMCI